MNVLKERLPIAVLAVLCLAGSALAQDPGRGAPDFDLLITNARVVDGTGNPWYQADVGIVGDTIVAVGRLSGHRAQRTVDAAGRVVAPGFIDVHTHVDDAFERPEASAVLNYLRQGVTTVRPGADGSSDHRVAAAKARWEANGMGMNAALTVGFNTVRREVMGEDFLRPATDGEIERMRDLVRQGMREGAWGISSGLEYEGLHVHAGTDEVLAVTQAVAEFDGFYISHMRDEGAHLADAVREIIRISEGAGVRVNVTHLKAAGRLQWGLMKEAVELIEAARARGVSVTADQYPFDQSAPYGYISELVDIPRDMEPLASLRARTYDRQLSAKERKAARAQVVAGLQEALRDPARRDRLRASTYEERDADWSAVAKWGWQDFRIKHAVKNTDLVEWNLLDLEKKQGRDGFDIVADLVLDEPDILYAGGSMSPEDLRFAMRRPWVMISSDGGGFAPVAPDASAVPSHPRSFASQAVVLRQFVREEGVLTLADAVRKMTSLPAQLLGLRDRGLVVEGFRADLVIFDPDAVRDRATWDDAHRYAIGIDYVIVNGKVSVEDGAWNGGRYGKVLLKK